MTSIDLRAFPFPNYAGRLKSELQAEVASRGLNNNGTCTLLLAKLSVDDMGLSADPHAAQMIEAGSQLWRATYGSLRQKATQAKLQLASTRARIIPLLLAHQFPQAISSPPRPSAPTASSQNVNRTGGTGGSTSAAASAVPVATNPNHVRHATTQDRASLDSVTAGSALAKDEKEEQVEEDDGLSKYYDSIRGYSGDKLRTALRQFEAGRNRPENSHMIARVDKLIDFAKLQILVRGLDPSFPRRTRSAASTVSSVGQLGPYVNTRDTSSGSTSVVGSVSHSRESSIGSPDLSSPVRPKGEFWFPNVLSRVTGNQQTDSIPNVSDSSSSEDVAKDTEGTGAKVFKTTLGYLDSVRRGIINRPNHQDDDMAATETAGSPQNPPTAVEERLNPYQSSYPVLDADILPVLELNGLTLSTPDRSTPWLTGRPPSDIVNLCHHLKTFSAGQSGKTLKKSLTTETYSETAAMINDIVARYPYSPSESVIQNCANGYPDEWNVDRSNATYALKKLHQKRGLAALEESSKK